RFDFLKLLWERLGLVRDGTTFSEELLGVSRRYSFLLSNGSIHHKVHPYLQRWALSSGLEATLTHDVCREAKELSDEKANLRSMEIKSKVNAAEMEQRKYGDKEWQNWVIDQINYQLWLQKADDAIEAVLNHVVTALMYGFSSFGSRLMSLCDEDSCF